MSRFTSKEGELGQVIGRTKYTQFSFNHPPFFSSITHFFFIAQNYPRTGVMTIKKCCLCLQPPGMSKLCDNSCDAFFRTQIAVKISSEKTDQVARRRKQSEMETQPQVQPPSPPHVSPIPLGDISCGVSLEVETSTMTLAYLHLTTSLLHSM